MTHSGTVSSPAGPGPTGVNGEELKSYGTFCSISGRKAPDFRSCRFIARANEYRGLRASIYGDVQHVCGNEDVISRPHDIAILELIASLHPRFHRR